MKADHLKKFQISSSYINLGNKNKLTKLFQIIFLVVRSYRCTGVLISP